MLVKFVYCHGYESNLGECTYTTTELSDCVQYGSDVIGVQCNPSITKIIQCICIDTGIFRYLYIDVTVIKNGELRLANGLHKYAGRVEIYWNSEWRRVCYDDWDEFDAQVVCRQINHFSTSIQILGTYYQHWIMSIKLTLNYT